MKPKAQFFPIMILVAAFLLTACAANQNVMTSEQEDARAIGIEAYIYGYPLVTMEITRGVMTNVPEPQGTRGPMGQFVKMRTYPDATFRDVTAPNADTLYTVAWIDVSKEPYILSLPDMKGRYFLFPLLDGWTTVFQVPGKRTTGTKAHTYAISGPGWNGPLPKGVTHYKSPTGMVWILGRIYCTGTSEDYAAVHALQDQCSLFPLSAYGRPYTPPPGTVDPSIDMKTAVREQVNRMDIGAYFKLMAELMKDNPPAAADADMVSRMAKIGIVPGRPFDIKKLDPGFVQALQDVPQAAFKKIMGHFKTAGTFTNGWLYTEITGIYGIDYLQRALITAIGLGANRALDAIYPTSEADADGKPYDGAQKYVMHFNKGEMPPADGFWSLTMYDGAYFFVHNPLNRYTLSSRNKLHANADGSVDLYIQKDSPGKDKEANWLPAPAGKFILMLRLYWPKAKGVSIITGSWKIPPVKMAQ
jgi:hypothetical protein